MNKTFVTILSIGMALPAAMSAQKTTVHHGYPIDQVPFTSVKVIQNTFWGRRLKAAHDVTIQQMQVDRQV